MLGELLAPFFRQRRNVDADEFAVVLWRHAEVGFEDGTLDVADGGFVEGLDGERAGVSGVDVADLLEGRRGTVVLYHQAIEHGRAGFAGADL